MSTVNTQHGDVAGVAVVVDERGVTVDKLLVDTLVLVGWRIGRKGSSDQFVSQYVSFSGRALVLLCDVPCAVSWCWVLGPPGFRSTALLLCTEFQCLRPILIFPTPPANQNRRPVNKYYC